MGSFASSIFSVMLSWIRSAVSYVWNAAATPEGGSLVRWLTEHWLSLAVILCIAGVAIDTVVHLLRWQPYKVWASFFRRMAGKQAEMEDPEPSVRRRPARTVQRHWVYADGTARTEAVEQDEYLPEEEAHPWQDVTPALPDYELDQEAYRRQFARPESLQKPLAGLEDYPQPAPVQMAEELPQQPESVQQEEVVEPVRKGRRLSRESTRMAFQQLFASHDEDELDLRYKPAQPAVDKDQAYNKPYYPPQWKPPAEVGAVTKDE